MTNKEKHALIIEVCKHREYDEVDTEEYFCTNVDLEDYGEDPEADGEPWWPCSVNDCPALKAM